MTRKLKSKLFAAILDILNSSIEEIQIKNENWFSKKIFILKLYFIKVEQDIIKNTNTEYNRNLLKSKLKDIFSHKISKQAKTHDPYHNKKIIKKIYNEQIQAKTISILERTLFECLEHFRGSQYYQELKGLEKHYENVINEMIESEKESNEYIDIFRGFISRFEVYYNKIKKIKPKRNKKIKKLKYCYC